MTSSPQRYALAALILVALWIVTYWLWPAAAESTASPGVTFADDTPAALDPIADEPRESDLPDRDPLRDLPPAETTRPAPPPVTPEQTAAPAASQSESSPATVAPRFTDYTVQRGDDMWSIARKVYGDRDRWDAVARANPTVDPQRLRVGQVLRIAVDPDNIQGVPVGAAPPPPDANPTEHVVAEGETLSGIAKTLYGRATLWRVILDANRHLLDDPQDLRPGMRLLIPPAPAGAGQ